MGAQQFGADTLHVDTRSFNRVLNFDSGSGLVEVEAGIQWPELIETTLKLQQDAQQQWGIAQKQTGADRLSMGGCLSANIHGRGLKLKPFVGDIESFKLVSADGQVMPCSRSQNSDLFKLAIGGYGLFGVVSSVTLRLMPRQKLQRVVELVQIDDVMQRFDQRIAGRISLWRLSVCARSGFRRFPQARHFFLLQAGRSNDADSCSPAGNRRGTVVAPPLFGPCG